MPASLDTDLTDDQWQSIKSLLPQHRRGLHSPRRYLEALLYLVKTGCQWRALPPCFPPWTAVYDRFRRWLGSGVLLRLHDALRALVRRKQGRSVQPTMGLLDSQSVPVANQGGLRGFDGGKRVWGRKRHILTDTLGLLLAVHVHSARTHDSQAAVGVLRRAPVPQLRRVVADEGYKGMPGGLVHRLLGGSFSLVARLGDGFVVLPRRWVVERTFAWLGRYRRLTRDVERHAHVSEAMVYLAMTRIMLNRL